MQDVSFRCVTSDVVLSWRPTDANNVFYTFKVNVGVPSQTLLDDPDFQDYAKFYLYHGPNQVPKKLIFAGREHTLICTCPSNDQRDHWSITRVDPNSRAARLALDGTELSAFDPLKQSGLSNQTPGGLLAPFPDLEVQGPLPPIPKSTYQLNAPDEENDQENLDPFFDF